VIHGLGQDQLKLSGAMSSSLSSRYIRQSRSSRS
jgi:hypothetical protein